MALPMNIDDELDEERNLLRHVGKAREIPDAFENSPQAYLEATHHPYAPFTGDTVHWNSWVYDDATTFEGLTRDAVPHGKGAMTFGKQGKGAGITGTKPGDRYEGEFHGGFAHGVGMFTSAEGVIFKGEFSAGLRDGCGAEYDLGPWRQKIKDGMDPSKAWREAREEVQQNIVTGTWNNDVFTSAASDIGSGCSLGEIKKTMYEVDSVVARSRMFQFKPAGDANFYKCHVNSAPVKPMQHPLHYPHGTLFMAPGPAGQTAALPADKGLRRLMLREWHNYNVIFSSYNFDYKPASDSLMAKAMRWWDKQQALRKREEALEAKIADQQMRRVTGAGSDVGDKSSKKSDTRPTGGNGRTSGVDESDLLASTALMAPANRSGSPQLGNAFGSMSFALRSARPGRRLQQLRDAVIARAPRMPWDKTG